MIELKYLWGGGAAGYLDVAVNPWYANGRRLTTTLENASAKAIVINNSPLFAQEVTEIVRVSRIGTIITFTAEAEACEYFYNQMKENKEIEGNIQNE